MATDTVVMADLSADPDVVREFPLGNYDGKPQRVIEYRWLVREDPDGSQVYVELTCYDDADRKRYWSVVGNVRKHGGIISSAPMSNTRGHQAHRARYAKPAFQAFALEALANLRVQQDDENVLAYRRGDHAVDSR